MERRGEAGEEGEGEEAGETLRDNSTTTLAGE